MSEKLHDFSFKRVRDWLAAQDPNTIYDAGDTKTCLLAQYTKAIGGEIIPHAYKAPDGSILRLNCAEWYPIIIDSRPEGSKPTFGDALAALDREISREVSDT